MNTQKIRPALPDSLKKRRLCKILVRVLSCAALLAFVIVSLVLWGEKIFPFPTQDVIGVRYLCYGLFFLLPFLITGVPLKLIDKSFSGTIRKVEIKDKINYGSGGSIKRTGSYIQSDLILVVERDDGKVIRYTRLSFGSSLYAYSTSQYHTGNAEHHRNEFREGERIHKYYGFKYPYIAHPTLPDDKYCIVCGQKNEHKEAFCWTCGAELLSNLNSL